MEPDLYLTRHDDGRYSVQLGAGPLSVATTLAQALRVYGNARASRYTYTAGERRHLDPETPQVWVAGTGEWEPLKTDA